MAKEQGFLRIILNDTARSLPYGNVSKGVMTLAGVTDTFYILAMILLLGWGKAVCGSFKGVLLSLS